MATFFPKFFVCAPGHQRGYHLDIPSKRKLKYGSDSNNQTSGKIDYKTKVYSNRQRHYIMIKGSIQENDDTDKTYMSNTEHRNICRKY